MWFNNLFYRKNMSTISINGKTMNISSNANIQIVNGKVIIDNKNVEYTFNDNHVIELHILEGSVRNISSDSSINCSSDIAGSVTAGSSVKCKNINGNVTAGSSVKCEVITGNVMAGSSVKTMR